MESKKRLTVPGAINILILLLFTFLCLYPMWYIFINSWSSPAAVNRGVYFIPLEFTTEAYTNLGQIPGLTSSIFISFARTISGTILTVLCSSFTAYLLADKFLPAKKFLYRYQLHVFVTGCFCCLFQIQLTANRNTKNVNAFFLTTSY